jgi:Tol biopolymer transport system component
VKVVNLTSACIVIGGIAAAQVPMRVSTEVDGVEGNNGSSSFVQAMSADGRYVVFTSNATNLVFSDVNDRADIFVRDITNWTITRASIASNGTPGNGDSSLPGISSDGAWIVYDSAATNLVPGDTNGHTDVFVRAHFFPVTERVSVGTGGVEANQGATRGNVSGDGHFVAFESHSDNLVAGDTNGDNDIFVRDRLFDTTERVSVSSTGAQAMGSSEFAHISLDGRIVVFQSTAPNLVLRDTNNTTDVFLHDRATGETTLISSSLAGVSGNGASIRPSLSDDGRWITFSSVASDLVTGDTNAVSDVFVGDTHTGVLMLVSRSTAGMLGNGPSDVPAISPDGHMLVFRSAANNLVAGDTNAQVDLFLRDLQADFTTRVSFEADGTQLTGTLDDPAISADGSYVSYWSSADDIVPGDTNGATDVFVVDTQSNAEIAAYGAGKANSLLCVPVIGASGLPSASGKTSFKITATNELGGKPGMFFWGRAAASIPFHGGTLLVAPPLIRTMVVNATGSSACNGTYSFTFDQIYILEQGLHAGDTFYCQYWSRDPGFPPPDDIALSNALRVIING